MVVLESGVIGGGGGGGVFSQKWVCLRPTILNFYKKFQKIL